MIKKLLLSLLIIVGVGAVAVTATQAVLSDEVTLTANTFSTGSVDLLINIGKTGGVFENTKTGFTGTLLPGETITNFFRLKNNDSGADLSISAQAVNIVPNPGITSGDVDVTFTAIDDDAAETPVGTPVTKTLSEWETVAALGAPDIPNDTTQRYKMQVKIHDDVSSPGATIVFDLVFTGTQVIPAP